MWAISGNIFAVCMCHIKIPSNFCFPISYLSVPKKSLYCSHYPPCYPRSGHLEWPYHSLYTLLVGIYGQWVCNILEGLPSWNSENCCDVYYVSGTNKMHLIPLVYFYCYIFTYMFEPVIWPSAVWHFCYKITLWSNLANYSTLLKFLW